MIPNQHLSSNEQKNINVYQVTETSRANQVVDEDEMHIHDFLIVGDRASFDSVKQYTRANIARKRELMDRKVVPNTRH